MARYTQAILAGLRRRGHSDEDVRRAIAASSNRFGGLSDGRFELTDRELERLEDLSDRTGGQLAVEGSDHASDLGLSAVMDAWGDYRDAAKAAPADPAPAVRRPRRA
jgi:hypothetical protein